MTKRSAVAFLLIVSLLASSAFAAPISRSLNSVDVIPNQPGSSTTELVVADYGLGRKLLDVKTNDYGDTAANSKHDPSTGSR